MKLYTTKFVILKHNKKTGVDMKKIIVLMMLFSIIFINRVIADGTNDSDDSNRIEIEINKIKND